MGTTLHFFTISHVLHAVDGNSMLVHCIASLCTTRFGHI